MLLVLLLVIVAGVLWYALRGRAWLKEQPWAQGYFATVEPIEKVLFEKSETMLVGRLMWAGGGLVTAYDSIATYMPSLDISPITSRIFSWIADDLRPLAVSLMVTCIGFLIGWLRKRTTKPLEVVALPIDSPPEVKTAAAKLDDANAKATAVIADAKAGGAV